MRKRQSSSFLCSSNSSIRSSNKNSVSSRCRFTFLSQLNRFTKHCKHIHLITLFSRLVIVESQSSVIPSVSGCHLSRAIPRSRLEFRRTLLREEKGTGEGEPPCTTIYIVAFSRKMDAPYSTRWNHTNSRNATEEEEVTECGGNAPTGNTITHPPPVQQNGESDPPPPPSTLLFFQTHQGLETYPIYLKQRGRRRRIEEKKELEMGEGRIGGN